MATNRPAKSAARSTVEEVPTSVLRNKGVPVTLYRLVNGQIPPEDDWVDGQPPTQQVHIRFTANEVCEIEDAFEPFTAEVETIVKVALTDSEGKAVIGPAGPETQNVVTGRETRVFYGLEAFQMSMERKIATTVRRCFAIALGLQPTEVGRAMIPDALGDYQAALGVAWSLSQGVDPKDAARILSRAQQLTVAKRAEMAAQMESQLKKMTELDSAETAGSPGPTGPPASSPTEGT